MSERDVEGFLRERFGGEIADVRPLAGGMWSDAFAFSAPGGELVVRFNKYADDFAKDRFAMRFTGRTLPIPRVVDTGETEDGHFAVTEFVDGTPLDECDADAWAHVMPRVLDAVDAMRTADTSGISGAGRWAPDGNGAYASWREYLLDVENDHVTSRTHGWRVKIDRKPDVKAAFDTGLRALHALIDAIPERRDVVHNDFLARNVFVDGARLTGVIDWGCALYGDSVYDAALMMFWQPWYDAMRDLDIPTLARARLAGDDARDFDERLRAYPLHIGLEHIAYNAFLELDHLPRICARTLEFAGS